jgi:nucleotide-binding universal stress UspA family protein
MKTNERHVIVAAVDGSAASDLVIDRAVVAARSLDGSEIHFVHVAEPLLAGETPASTLAELVADGRSILANAVRRANESFGGRVESHLSVDIAESGVLQAAADLEAELVIVGSHGHHRLERFVLGSVSRAVVDHARCTVLIARPSAYPARTTPAIDPSCPGCLETQRKTHGERLWCPEHASRSLRPHLHYRIAPPFAVGAGLP